MSTRPHLRLARLLCAGALVVGTAGHAVADACDGNDVMQVLGAAEASPAYVQCKMDGVASAFHGSAGSLIENLELLYDFSADPAASQDPTLPDAVSGARGERAQLKDILYALDGIDWTAADSAASAGDQISQGTEIINRLTAPLTPIQPSAVAAAHRNSFCEVKLNWKLARLWSDRAVACVPP